MQPTILRQLFYVVLCNSRLPNGVQETVLNMEKFEKLMLPITMLLLGVLGWVFLSSSNDELSTKSIPVATTTSNTYETKNGEMGAVMVKVKPIKSNVYEFTFNTHSVDLDFDFTQIITLKDNLGNTYNPNDWSGDKGGHHLQGTIEFAEIAPEAKNVTITVRDIESKVLNFEWSL